MFFNPRTSTHKNAKKAAPWILPEKGSGITDILESHIAPHLNRVNVRMTIVHNDVIRQLVASGLGISFISTLSLGRLVDKTDLVTLNTPFLGLKRIFYRVIRKNDSHFDWLNPSKKTVKF
ncbi:LysR substrate-binding domain-containing protein [Legionella drozanskii]|uniref:HTH-type transcriptional activator CmpR n=1 Tax=Legionella drozanskii LLAP-1 TaxID=1212489 RepID=A0A0W0SY73_9GAMM|nr:HTH-type transcriptional activator CmpR [Legionella drozanskii LLAP-1]